MMQMRGRRLELESARLDLVGRLRRRRAEEKATQSGKKCQSRRGNDAAQVRMHGQQPRRMKFRRVVFVRGNPVGKRSIW